MKALRQALRQVVGNRSVRRIEIGWLVAVAAEWTYLVSLLVFAYNVAGVVGVGLLSTLRMLPAAVLSPFLSGLADRFPRVRVLAAVHAGRATAVALAAVAVASGLPPVVAFVAAIAEGIIATLHRPATLSLLPALARSPEELIAGNAVTSTGEAVGVLIGPTIAGLLLVVDGPAIGMGLPAIAFAVASIAVLSVGTGGTRPSPPPDPSLPRLSGALAGFRAMRSYPSAGSITVLFVSQTFVRGILTVLLVAASVELLGLGTSGVGYLNSAIGAGGLLGAMVALTLVVRRELAPPVSISLAMWGIPIAIIGLVPQSPVAFAFLGLLGMANAVLDVSGFTLLQRCVPNGLRGRVFGALESLIALSVASGSLVAPALVALLGLQGAMVLTGVLLPVLALVTAPTVRNAEAAAVVPRRQLSLLRGVPMFAPLSLTALERLAGGMLPVHFGAGQAAVRQGERGDDYFLIGSGTADVVQDGDRIAELREGDGFGEIALLRDVPRTASVIVRDRLDGFSLPRSVFLEAVTGSAVSIREADWLVAERLASADS